MYLFLSGIEQKCLITVAYAAMALISIRDPPFYRKVDEYRKRKFQQVLDKQNG
jgi:phosphoribosylcarboxyaminoimidazole (NCAIR) mutase